MVERKKNETNKLDDKYNFQTESNHINSVEIFQNVLACGHVVALSKIFHKIFNEIASFGSVQPDPARLDSADVLNDFHAAFSRFFSLALMHANCVSSEINKIVQLPFYILI